MGSRRTLPLGTELSVMLGGPDRRVLAQSSAWAKARARLAASVLAIAVVGCHGSGGKPDAGEVSSRSLLEHVEARGRAMPDARYRAQLFADLGVELVEAPAPPCDPADASCSINARARALLDQGRDVAKAIRSQEDRDLALEVVAEAMARAGFLDEASALAGEVRNGERRGRIGLAVAARFASRGAFDRALAAAAAVPEGESKSAAYAEVALALAASGDFVRAIEVGHKATSEDDASRLLAALAIGHAREKKFGAAKNAADQITNPRFKSEAEEGLAVELYRRGDERGALRLLEVIDSGWIRARAYFLVARVASAQGKRARATKLGDRARAIAEGINDPVVRGSAEENLARLTLEDGAVKEALELGAKAGSREIERKIIALAVARYAKEKNIPEAMKLARSISSDPVWSADALGPIAVAHAAAGQIPTAFEVLAQIPSLELRLPYVARVAALAGATPAPPEVVDKIERVLR